MEPDSSGFSTERCEAWFDIKTNRHKSKKSYIKLHILIAVQSLAIISFDVTKGTQGDAPVLKKLLKGIPKGVGDFCADSAYLSRDICNMVATLQKTPYIKPRKNTTTNSKGSQSWKKMASLFQENKDEFDVHHHKRSLVESVFAVLKIVFGNNLSSKKQNDSKKRIGVACHLLQHTSC